MEIDKNEVGKRIKTIRINLKETTAEFAKHFNPPASDSLVSRWERGVNLPNNERIKEIARLGNLSVDQLLYGDLNITVSVDEYLTDKLNSYLENKMKIIRRQINLAVEPFLQTIDEPEDTELINNDDTHLNQCKAFKKIGLNYIENNFKQYSYEVFKNNFSNPDSTSFEKYKENEWEIMKEVLDNLWESYDISKKGNVNYWINDRFTKQVKENLERIIELAVQENKEDYYINDLVQPILDEAADKINNINISNQDAE